MVRLGDSGMQLRALCLPGRDQVRGNVSRRSGNTANQARARQRSAAAERLIIRRVVCSAKLQTRAGRCGIVAANRDVSCRFSMTGEREEQSASLFFVRLALVLFIATVFAANWAVERFGVVPVGCGHEAPAAV